MFLSVLSVSVVKNRGSDGDGGLLPLHGESVDKNHHHQVVAKCAKIEYLCLNRIKEMRNGETINHIVSEIEKLDYKGKISVLSEIVDLLKGEGGKKQSTEITNLKGLGKKIWQQTDIDSYLIAERESWD